MRRRYSGPQANSGPLTTRCNAKQDGGSRDVRNATSKARPTSRVGKPVPGWRQLPATELSPRKNWPDGTRCLWDRSRLLFWTLENCSCPRPSAPKPNATPRALRGVSEWSGPGSRRARDRARSCAAAPQRVLGGFDYRASSARCSLLAYLGSRSLQLFRCKTMSSRWISSGRPR